MKYFGTAYCFSAAYTVNFTPFLNLVLLCKIMYFLVVSSNSFRPIMVVNKESTTLLFFHQSTTMLVVLKYAYW
jgi:hypothetical protein